MPSTSDVNRSAQRKGGKKGRRSRAGGGQLSSYDAAGASMALPRDNLSESQTFFWHVLCQSSVECPPASPILGVENPAGLDEETGDPFPLRSPPPAFPLFLTPSNPWATVSQIRRIEVRNEKIKDSLVSKPPQSRWHLGCILLKIPAKPLLAGGALVHASTETRG